MGHLFCTKELKSQRLSNSLGWSFVWFYYYRLYSIAQLCPTLCSPMTVACQSPLFMKFSRQEYWSELSFPTTGDLLHPGMNLGLLNWQVDSLPLVPPVRPHIFSDGTHSHSSCISLSSNDET